MKLTKSIFGIALTAIGFGALISCSNELSDPSRIDNGTVSLKLVKTPDVIAWSGSQYLSDASTRSLPTRAEEAVTYETVETKSIDRDEEAKFVDEKLPEKNGNIKEDLDTDFLFYSGTDVVTFEMYPVSSQTTTPNSLTVFYFKKGQNQIDTKTVWDEMNPYQLTSTVDEGYTDENGQWVSVPTIYSKGVKITIQPGYYFGFVWNGHYWPIDGYSPRETHLYSSSELNPKSYCTDGGGAKLDKEPTSIHAIRFEHDGKTYLGFEDWTDFDYQDWVFTCNVQLQHVNSSEIFDEDGEINPSDPDDEEYCDWSEECKNGNHLKHEPGHCDQCPEGKGCNAPTSGGNEGDGDNNVDNPGTPSNPGNGYKHDNEVEVNFEVVDSHEWEGKNIGDLVTKLSIHVRYGTDVDIKIPVPSTYIIESDDLYIFHEHYGENGYHGTYGGSQGGLLSKNANQTLPYNINGTIVTLHVDFVLPDDETATGNLENGYIHVWTEGIDDGVIAWCMEHNGDGINFEIWNYYQTEYINSDGNKTRLERSTLLELLNQSTIEFLDDNPDYYINAFGWDYVDGTNGAQHTEGINLDDCTVKPVDSTTFGVRPHHRGTHLNGTPYNDIYVNKDAKPDHAHGGGN